MPTRREFLKFLGLAGVAAKVGLPKSTDASAPNSELVNIGNQYVSPDSFEGARKRLKAWSERKHAAQTELAESASYNPEATDPSTKNEQVDNDFNPDNIDSKVEKIKPGSVGIVRSNNLSITNESGRVLATLKKGTVVKVIKDDDGNYFKKKHRFGVMKYYFVVVTYGSHKGAIGYVAGNPYVRWMSNY